MKSNATIKLETMSLDECTIGLLTIGDFQCFTLELPWKDNQRNISCIPAGTYEYIYRISPSNGEVLQLLSVKDRTFIQIHAGNFTRHTEGCILVGDRIMFIDDDTIPDVGNSKATLQKLLAAAGRGGTIEVKRCEKHQHRTT